MRHVTLQRRIEAPRSAVWAVLADYPNISAWNSGVKESHATSDATEGIGATRHCDLAPVGGLEETIRKWEPETTLAISIDSASKLPMKKGLATFELADDGDATDFGFDYEYEPRGGPLAALIGPMLDRQFRKGFGGFLDDLETAAKKAG